jgi:hypothetical protein
MAQEEALRALICASASALLTVLACASASAAPPEKGPVWAELTVDQQQVLAPLKQDWSKLERERKLKWLGIAKRYPSLKPEEQQRVQRRMAAWAKLTPEQRGQARQRYRNIGKLSPEGAPDLRRLWAEYQALPPHERRMFDVPPESTRSAERQRRAKPKRPPAHTLPAPM